MVMKVSDEFKNMGKLEKKRKGKVIRHFTVEVVSADTDPILFTNAVNVYAGLSEEERMKDLVDIFGLLWAESCRVFSQRDQIDREIQKVWQSKKII